MNTFLINKAEACTPRLIFDETGDIVGMDSSGCISINDTNDGKGQIFSQLIVSTYQNSPQVFWGSLSIVILFIILIILISRRLIKERFRKNNGITY